jgi:transcriptional regulator of acetoin/glycerol metabolism
VVAIFAREDTWLLAIMTQRVLTVLIQAETGTGKELIAHTIHNASSRSGQPLIKLNYAAIPFDLLESELFGHERGAFTGAIAQKMGITLRSRPVRPLYLSCNSAVSFRWRRDSWSRCKAC